MEFRCCQKIQEYFLTYPSLVVTESTLATGLINVLILDARRLSLSCLTSRSVLGSPASFLPHKKVYCFTATRNIYPDNTCLCSFCSLIRGSTIKTSRINVQTATVPTQTLRHCRSTCQRMPSKTLRPTAVVCVVGHTPQ